MNPVRSLQLFLLRTLATGAVAGYLVSVLQPAQLPATMRSRPYTSAMVAAFLVQLLYTRVIYPKFLYPLRDLPTVHGQKQRGQILYESPRGKTALAWMQELPEAELIAVPGQGGLSPVIVAGPEALRDILSTHADDFVKPWGVRAFLARAIGWGLILAEGPAHRVQRRALTPGFHLWRVRELYGLMWAKTQILLREVDREIQGQSKVQQEEDDNGGFGVVELSEWASKLTLDIIGPTAVGRDFESLTAEANPIADAFREMLRPEVRRLVFLALHFMIPEWVIRRLPLKENTMLNEIGAYLKGVCSDIIREKKGGLEKKGALLAEHDILSRIIQTGEFTDDQVADQMMTFLAAGHETTASALTWACYLCAKYPDIQTKLRAEIHDRIPSSASPITWDLLESMPYLHGVCEETLRLYPTVPATVREAIRDTTVAGRRVPQGTGFLLVPYAINRHPRHWTDPHRMVPERWSDEVEEEKKEGDGTSTTTTTTSSTSTSTSRRPNKTGGTTTNLAELTFLHGPRACIGRDFAKAELRCAVAGVLGKFELQLHTEEEPRVQGVITMKPEGGLYLRMKPLSTW